MEYNLDGEEDELLDKLEEAIHHHGMFHAKQIIEKDLGHVNDFIANSTNLVLSKIDEIEGDNELVLELTKLVGTLMGGMGKAILELKEDNIQLKTDFIIHQIENQNPDLN